MEALHFVLLCDGELRLTSFETVFCVSSLFCCTHCWIKKKMHALIKKEKHRQTHVPSVWHPDPTCISVFYSFLFCGLLNSLTPGTKIPPPLFTTLYTLHRCRPTCHRLVPACILPCVYQPFSKSLALHFFNGFYTYLKQVSHSQM